MDRTTPSEELTELHQLLLQQAAEYALIMLDPDGKIVDWLAGSERIFGYTVDEILGEDSSRLFTPEDVERGIPQLELEVAKLNGHAEDDRWQMRKDGGRIWASGAVSPLRRQNGQLVGFGKILRNRTDQKARIESLENQCEALARADERKNLFLGTLAHELRNPLAPLVNAVELVRLSVPDTPDLSFAITLIRRQIDFIQRLVDDLLDVARIGAGKVQLQKQMLDLNDLLRDVVDTCGTQIQQRRQNIEIITPATPIRLHADATRLSQVLTNLVDNASKYTHEGGRIWLKATVEESDAVVRVVDTGIGISAEILPRIFEMFTQEETATAKAPGGLGIGLSLVKELVTLHGGKVLVRSDGRDKGSEFTVRLPLAESDG